MDSYLLNCLVAPGYLTPYSTLCVHALITLVFELPVRGIVIFTAWLCGDRRLLFDGVLNASQRLVMSSESSFVDTVRAHGDEPW